MKRFIALGMVSILVASIIAGCSGRPSDYYIDPNETINTVVDRDFVIALDSNPTAGYDWEVSYDNNVLTLLNKEYTLEKCPGLVGAGGTQYLFFKAQKIGNTEITLSYKRSWEAQANDKKVFTVDIK
ncbi:protease inhibitor I42 family protein [Chloroflexota bacterium]